MSEPSERAMEIAANAGFDIGRGDGWLRILAEAIDAYAAERVEEELVKCMAWASERVTEERRRCRAYVEEALGPYNDISRGIESGDWPEGVDRG